MKMVKWLVGLVVVVLQMVVSHFSYDAATVFERWVGLNDPLPLFMPLLLTIAYGIYCRNALLVSMVGLLSWLVFPIVVSVFHRDYPPLSSVPWLLLFGLLYALIGFVVLQWKSDS